jgi:DNA polymerase V
MRSSPASQGQQEIELGDTAVAHERRQARLMRALDAVNDRFGRGTLTLGSAGLCQEPGRRWTMRQERRTPRYTTCWDELLTVSA